MKKYLLIPVLLIVFTSFASAQFFPVTDAIQAQINNLIKQIQALQEQLAKKMAEQQVMPPAFCYDFNQDLKISDRGVGVDALVTVLVREGIIKNPSNENILGEDFNEQVAAAVVAFQEKYRDAILTPAGLKNGTGYVGPSTRAKLNKLYGCSVVTPPNTPPNTPPGSIEPLITILSPNGGEVFKTGNKYMIKWNSANIPSTQDVRIALRYVQNDPTYPGGTNIEEWIVEKIPNTGSYEWKVPEVYGLGMDEAAFRIRVSTLTYELDYADYSNSTFTIKLGDSNPNLTVTSPVVGTNYSNGQTIAIEWTPAYSTGDTVRFTLLRKGDKSFSRWVNTYYSNDKKWSWNVPTELSGNDYFLRVETTSNALSRGIGYSGVFGINSSVPPNTPLSLTASRLGDANNRSRKDPDDISTLTFVTGTQKAKIKSLTLHFKGDAIADEALPKSIRLINTGTDSRWNDSSSKSCVSNGTNSCKVTFNFSDNTISANSSKVINVRIDSTKINKGSITTAVDLVWSEGEVDMNLGAVPFEIANVSY